jgi:hypothetical protein
MVTSSHVFFATDIANFLACRHLMTLERAEAAGHIQKPFFQDPGADLLHELGIRHEQAFLRHLAQTNEILLTIDRRVREGGSAIDHFLPSQWSRIPIGSVR